MPAEELETKSETPGDSGGPYGRVFGVGEFPPELNRFSWGAFLLPFFWGIAYRSWPVMTAWVVGTTAPFLFASLFGVEGKTPAVATFIAAEVLSQIVAGVARLWAGANAYRTLWRRDAFLNELGRPPGRGEIGAFLGRQRAWMLVGAVAMVLVTAATVPLSSKFWGEYGLSVAGPAISVGWLAAEVGLGLWLARQMREEHSAEDPRFAG